MRRDRTGAEVVQRRLLEAALIRGLLTNEEGACFEPFMMEAGPPDGRPPRDHRRNLDAILFHLRLDRSTITGAGHAVTGGVP